jgi:formate dehydrogenase gamma subunit
MSSIIENKDGKRVFVRFTLSQRIEHAIQIVSFTTLVLTGIAQKYNTHVTAEWIIHIFGGIEMTRTIHRVMGIVLIIESVVHIAIIGWAFLKGRREFRMLPNFQDVRDAIQMVLYFVGLRKHRARFDRYDFRQKAEYWALVWGTVVMVVTGLMMWFPVETTAFLPGEMIPAARAAHSGEGLLAFLAILIWHMYSAHLAPEVFPFDTGMFTGKISEERMIHEHPLEYERLIDAQSPAKAPAPLPDTSVATDQDNG